MIKLILGDVLEKHQEIEDGSVDLICTDLPYGTIKGINLNGYDDAKTEWDVVIDTCEIMRIAERILRPNGRMVLFAQEPFTNHLLNHATPALPFSYRAIWKKDDFANGLAAGKAMVNFYEDILIFKKDCPSYDFENKHPLRPYFQNVFEFIGKTKKQIIGEIGQRVDHTLRFNSTQFSLCTLETYNDLIRLYNIGKMESFETFDKLIEVDRVYRDALINNKNGKFPSVFNLWEGRGHKSNILQYKKDRTYKHPTQKPVDLIEDLIKTFSNEGDTVVDLTMGSGTTMVACNFTRRHGIGIEKNADFFKVAEQRVKSEVAKQTKLFI